MPARILPRPLKSGATTALARLSHPYLLHIDKAVNNVGIQSHYGGPIDGDTDIILSMMYANGAIA